MSDDVLQMIAAIMPASKLISVTSIDVADQTAVSKIEGLTAAQASVGARVGKIIDLAGISHEDPWSDDKISAPLR